MGHSVSWSMMLAKSTSRYDRPPDAVDTYHTSEHYQYQPSSTYLRY